jgi:hypothetical protein
VQPNDSVIHTASYIQSVVLQISLQSESYVIHNKSLKLIKYMFCGNTPFFCFGDENL